MSEQKIDVLNREPFIDKLMRMMELLSQDGKGCCFGINGVWGSGKSFILERFENRLKDIHSEETFDNKYFVFHYDCWEYDYYDEPAIAIISSMLDVADKQVNLISSEVKELAIGTAWGTARDILAIVAGELCKNKIGIDLVTVFNESLKEQKDIKIDDFNKVHGFKRALEETRENIQKIAENKTIVIVVDELDRCLPKYSIKVLERIHHIFEGLENVIVIISMDKSQLEHSIRGIYGDINVDTYLRKFISFKIDLDKGVATKYGEKYSSYFSMFNVTTDKVEIIEELFVDIFEGLDMRTQERIFRKAEIIHGIISEQGKEEDCSILSFEILFLTVAQRLESKDLKWLGTIWKSTYVGPKKKLGEAYYSMLNEYGATVRSSMKRNNTHYINKTLIAKTFFWLAVVFEEYYDLACDSYYYVLDNEESNDSQIREKLRERAELVYRFSELIDIIDCD
ncbi:MAG: hypothetical protein IJO60_05250 [Agathobacter sp.]|nr:hypothetical protein [Agathobacter sp.]